MSIPVKNPTTPLLLMVYEIHGNTRSLSLSHWDAEDGSHESMKMGAVNR